jgi:hypothetical protein
MKIKFVLLMMVILGLSSAIFAENSPRVFGELKGEMCTGGTPYLTIGCRGWPNSKYSIGINLSLANWEQNYSEYPTSYNRSEGKIYMIGSRIERQVWETKFNAFKDSKGEMKTYVVVEVNAIVARTTWIKETFWQKALLVGTKIFPVKENNFYIALEAGASHEAGVSEITANNDGYGTKLTYNIGCGYTLRRWRR